MNQPIQTPSAPTKPKLRWFQFSIRTLLFVMLLVCCGLGWLGWLLNDVRERAAAIKMITNTNGHLFIGEPTRFGRSAIIRSMFGENAFAPIKHIYLGREATNSHLSCVKRMNQLESITLSETQVTDLSPLAGLKSLKELQMDRTRATNLSPLAGLHNLQKLIIRDAPVHDLSPLAGLSKLTYLRLDRTHVSDLSPLAVSTSLTEVYLVDTQVSDLSPLVEMNRLVGSPGTELEFAL